MEMVQSTGYEGIETMDFEWDVEVSWRERAKTEVSQDLGERQGWSKPRFKLVPRSWWGNTSYNKAKSAIFHLDFAENKTSA